MQSEARSMIGRYLDEFESKRIQGSPYYGGNYSGGYESDDYDRADSESDEEGGILLGGDLYGGARKKKAKSKKSKSKKSKTKKSMTAKKACYRYGTNPWLHFVALYRKRHPSLSYREAMEKASTAYKQQAPYRKRYCVKKGYNKGSVGCKKALVKRYEALIRKSGGRKLKGKSRGKCNYTGTVKKRKLTGKGLMDMMDMMGY